MLIKIKFSVYVFVIVTFATLLRATPVDHTKITKDVKLNSWIRYYEPAHYDPQLLHSEHRRVRRSLGGNPYVRLDIKGHGRVFKLKLAPDRNVFTEDAIFETTNGPINFSTNSIYSGTLEDDDSAFVHGIITKEGLFDGTVHTKTNEFYIEPISRYLSSNNSTKSPSFHSIVYTQSDIESPPKPKTCASHLLFLNRTISEDLSGPVARSKRWLLEGEAKSPYDDNQYWTAKRYPLNPPFDQPIDEIEMELSHRNYSDTSGLLFGRNFNKRATVDPKKTTCMLYLQADHQFFQKYGTEEACIEVMTRHVQRVNLIYKSTDFNQDGKSDNITFMVKRIKVHTSDALRDPMYRFPNNYGVEKFLELFSEEDYDAFCLAYMFTYRDFEMGTLGLAWTGDLKNAGGVCEKNGHYRGSMKSLNTGIVTLLNYGKHVPPAVSHVTLAHEIGHNFGSPHDPEICTPGGEDGNFIMFARATSGDKKNNNHFSPCSLKSINPVLNFKARSPKGCFTEPQTSLCGNGVVEEGEECDCGWEEDCKDECCWPQRKVPPIDEPPCRLRGHSVCSPSQGPCCTTTCQLKFGQKCRDDNGCRDASFCDGRGPKCPPSINKPNKTICNEEYVCFMGECTGSICLAYGLESCQCIPSTTDPKTKACELCCKLPGDNQPCLSSFLWNESPYDIPDMYSKPGTPCNDYNGYCDVFQMCREVDPSGPLATLRKMLLSDESIASFKRWVMDYWYAVLAIILVVIGLLILSTRLLGKKPQVKQKSVTIIHSQTTETVRLPDDDGQITVHPALRSKVPLKRKVRNGKKLGRKPKTKEPTNNNNVSSPNKGKGSPKRKKRVSAAIGVEETRKKTGDTTAIIEIPPSKVKKPNGAASKKRKKRKEVIDYSVAQADGKDCLISSEVLHTPVTVEVADPVGKVQNWLLKSHGVMPKSKSTPAGLTDKTNRSPHKRPTIRPRADKSKSHSIGNLPGDKEKVRLQVVYKPPFKFSVKLKKPEKIAPLDSRVAKKLRTGVLVKTVRERDAKHKKNAVKPSQDEQQVSIPSPNIQDKPLPKTPDDIDSNIHTVQSDLEVLLSEGEFIFSDD